MVRVPARGIFQAVPHAGFEVGEGSSQPFLIAGGLPDGVRGLHHQVLDVGLDLQPYEGEVILGADVQKLGGHEGGVAVSGIGDDLVEEAAPRLQIEEGLGVAREILGPPLVGLHLMDMVAEPSGAGPDPPVAEPHARSVPAHLLAQGLEQLAMALIGIETQLWRQGDARLPDRLPLWLDAEPHLPWRAAGHEPVGLLSRRHVNGREQPAIGGVQRRSGGPRDLQRYGLEWSCGIRYLHHGFTSPRASQHWVATRLGEGPGVDGHPIAGIRDREIIVQGDSATHAEP